MFGESLTNAIHEFNLIVCIIGFPSDQNDKNSFHTTLFLISYFINKWFHTSAIYGRNIFFFWYAEYLLVFFSEYLPYGYKAQYNSLNWHTWKESVRFTVRARESRKMCLNVVTKLCGIFSSMLLEKYKFFSYN